MTGSEGVVVTIPGAGVAAAAAAEALVETSLHLHTTTSRLATPNPRQQDPLPTSKGIDPDSGLVRSAVLPLVIWLGTGGTGTSKRGTRDGVISRAEGSLGEEEIRTEASLGIMQEKEVRDGADAVGLALDLRGRRFRRPVTRALVLDRPAADEHCSFFVASWRQGHDSGVWNMAWLSARIREGWGSSCEYGYHHATLECDSGWF